MRILLVDDEIELVSTLSERLEYRGIEADWVTNAADAMAKAQEHVYDVAVLDIRMPGVDGFQLKKQLQETNADMKFIFMTGHGSEEYYHIGTRETGREFFLVKPVNIDVLIQKIKEIRQS